MAMMTAPMRSTARGPHLSVIHPWNGPSRPLSARFRAKATPSAPADQPNSARSSIAINAKALKTKPLCRAWMANPPRTIRQPLNGGSSAGGLLVNTANHGPQKPPVLRFDTLVAQSGRSHCSQVAPLDSSRGPNRAHSATGQVATGRQAGPGRPTRRVEVPDDGVLVCSGDEPQLRTGVGAGGHEPRLVWKGSEIGAGWDVNETGLLFSYCEQVLAVGANERSEAQPLRCGRSRRQIAGSGQRRSGAEGDRTLLDCGKPRSRHREGNGP